MPIDKFGRHLYGKHRVFDHDHAEVNVYNKRLRNLNHPEKEKDAVTKGYVDRLIKLQDTTELNVEGKRIGKVGLPEKMDDAVNKQYVKDEFDRYDNKTVENVKKLIEPIRQNISDAVTKQYVKDEFASYDRKRVENVEKLIESIRLFIHNRILLYTRGYGDNTAVSFGDLKGIFNPLI